MPAPDDLLTPPDFGSCPECGQRFYIELNPDEPHICAGETGTPVTWTEVPYGTDGAPGSDAVHADDYVPGEMSEEEQIDAMLAMAETMEAEGTRLKGLYFRSIDKMYKDVIIGDITLRGCTECGAIVHDEGLHASDVHDLWPPKLVVAPVDGEVQR